MLNFFTSTSVPEDSPKNLVAYNTSSTSIGVNWTAINESLWHGIPLGYHIYYGLHVGHSVLQTRVDSTTLYVELTGLRKFRVYNITVVAYASKGNGPQSGIVASTEEDGMC